MSTRVPPPVTVFPNIIGSPGGSLRDLGGKFGAGQVTAGADGEIRTARALANICQPGGPTVLHDLVLPMNGITANIDHIVISGKDVYILDSKMWTPGLYWTIAGRTRRGWTRVEHTDRQTMRMATTAINKLLSNTGVRFVMKRPVLIVWSSNTKKQMVLSLFRPFAAKAATGRRFAAHTRRYAGTQPANQALVAALVPLVISLRHQNQRQPATMSKPTSQPAPTVTSTPEFLPEPIAEIAPARTVYESDDF